MRLIEKIDQERYSILLSFALGLDNPSPTLRI